MTLNRSGNGHVQGWLKIGLAVLVMLASGYGGYVALRASVAYNSGQIEKIGAKADANEKCVIRLQADIDFIKGGVDKTAANQQLILTELRNRP